MNARRWLVFVLAVMLPGVVMLPVWQLGGLGAQEDDLLYYFPSRTLLHDSLQRGEIPWINPYNGVGRPLAADPQTALWYPTTWLFAISPVELAYPASLWIHYSLALLGMYRLLRAQAMGRDAAMLGAIAFAFCGFMLAHRAHFTMQHAAAWMPIVWWRVTRFADAGGATRLLSAAVVAGLQCLAGHVQIAALSALGLIVWFIGRDGLRPSIALLRYGVTWLSAGGLYAVQWMPTLAYVGECTRGQRGYMDFVENSWCPQSAITWLLPMLLGQRTPNFFPVEWWGPSHQVEQLGYVGLVPLTLALLALRGAWRGDEARRPWVVLAGFSVLLALGLYGPICPLLYWLPGASLFRVPARAMLLVSLAACVLAAWAFDQLSGDLSPTHARLRAALRDLAARPLVVTCVILGGAILATVAALPLLDAATRGAALRSINPLNPAIWLSGGMIAATCLVLRRFARFGSPRGTTLAIAALLTLDLTVLGWTIDAPPGANSPRALLHEDSRARIVDLVRRSGQRVWVVTSRENGKPGEYVDSALKGVANVNILDSVESLTDYGPLQPRSLSRQFEFKPWGESDAAARLLANTDWTRRFDVGWILVCNPELPAPEGGRLALTTSRAFRLYRMPETRGRAFVDFGGTRCEALVESSTVVGDTVRVTEVDTSTTRAAPASLVISRLACTGWHASVNGVPTPIAQTDDGLIGIALPSSVSSARVKLVYSPTGLREGGLTSIVTLCLLLAFAVTDAFRGFGEFPEKTGEPEDAFTP